MTEPENDPPSPERPAAGPGARSDPPRSFLDQVLGRPTRGDADGGGEGDAGGPAGKGDGAEPGWYERMRVRYLPTEEKERGRER